jgi:subtilisin family serine protease
MAYFSAIGPAPDGRNKPDVTAPGYSLFSVKASSEDSEQPSCSIESKAGTSMATPVTSGHAALIEQYFRDSNFWAKYCDQSYSRCASGAFIPSGALLKALLMQSGDQMSSYPGGGTVHKTTLHTPPDVFQGYGRINLENVLPLVSASSSSYTLFIDETYVTQLTERKYSVAVTSTSHPLKVTLVWMDPPNSEFAAKVLLHDLDLVVESPSGAQYLGNGKGQSSGVTRDEVNPVSFPVANFSISL